jgi:membrane-associated protein
MDSISSALLTGVVSYGTPILGLFLLLSGLGLPLPTTLLVVAAGAFSRQGALDWVWAAGFGLFCTVLGDSLSFAIGHFSQGWLEQRLGSTQAWLQAQLAFANKGGLAIYFTRFLVTAIALPVNLIAGGSGYRYIQFLLYDVMGEATWIGVYGGLGYIFGSQWELISDFLGDFGGLVLGLVILGAGIYFWRRHYAKRLAGVMKPVMQPTAPVLVYLNGTVKPIFTKHLHRSNLAA